MTAIPQKDLRDNLGEVLRRVEAGEDFTVTVFDRPVAHLRPAQTRRWVKGRRLARIWDTPAPETLHRELGVSSEPR